MSSSAVNQWDSSGIGIPQASDNRCIIMRYFTRSLAAWFYWSRHSVLPKTVLLDQGSLLTCYRELFSDRGPPKDFLFDDLGNELLEIQARSTNRATIALDESEFFCSESEDRAFVIHLSPHFPICSIFHAMSIRGWTLESGNSVKVFFLWERRHFLQYLSFVLLL